MVKTVNITNEELLKMHWEENMNLAQIGERLGYTKNSAYTIIPKLFKERGLARRTRGQAIALYRRLNPESHAYCTREHSPQWKGGRHYHSAGYIVMTAPEGYKGTLTYKPLTRHSSGEILEHRFVWEQAHGRFLQRGELIHHLNGIKDDNRPENLVMVNPHNHERHTFIKHLQARIRELEQLRMNL